MSDRIWTTKEGKQIAVEDMESHHLLNAHRFVCGHIESIREMRMFGNSFFAPSVGTIAEEHFEQALDEMEEEMPALGKWKSWLEDEIVIRDLIPFKHKKAQRMPEIEKSESVVVNEKAIGTIYKLKKGE